MKLKFLFLLTVIAGCSPEKSYEGEVRSSVTNFGALKTLELYEEAARSGNGEDLLRLYWLLEIDGHLIPNYKYSSLEGSEAILNCAAETGFAPAVKRAAFRIRAAHNPKADAAAKCVADSRVASDQLWHHCGAQAFLPPCPAEFRTN